MNRLGNVLNPGSFVFPNLSVKENVFYGIFYLLGDLLGK